jgi:uncharacterized protein YdeI (YjbR/CyaY-like superfamily)
MNVVFFTSAAALRAWMESNHEVSTELHIGFYKKQSGKPGVTYSESVDEALCFGWIDGVRNSIDAASYTVRFTPRKARSKWSAVNIERVRKLNDAGRMKTAGLDAFAGAPEQSRAYSYEQRNAARFDATAERQFRSKKLAWQFFQTQPPWYRRTATWWVISAKKEETRQKRLAQLIADSGRGRTIAPLTRKSAVPKRKMKAQ